MLFETVCISVYCNCSRWEELNLCCLRQCVQVSIVTTVVGGAKSMLFETVCTSVYCNYSRWEELNLCCLRQCVQVSIEPTVDGRS